MPACKPSNTIRPAWFGAALCLSMAAHDVPAADATSDKVAGAATDGIAVPRMVDVPAGDFRMGHDAAPLGTDTADEVPVRQLHVAAFSLGRMPVTRGEFASFVAATGYRTDAERDTPIDGEPAPGCFIHLGGEDFRHVEGRSWRDPGFAQDDDHPVVCVSWHDAQSYVAWLSSATGLAYRLPTETEQEYAIRAGGTSRYPWGEDAGDVCKHANTGDQALMADLPDWPYATSACSDGFAQTSPSGIFLPNAFGLHDTIGNVWEWSSDCYVDHYDSNDTAARDDTTPADCPYRALRGVGWTGRPEWLRASDRFWTRPASRNYGIGFRVALDR